ncbi:MAG: hypothetical protein WB586_13000 [Chthoniobacterales bacterium]
MNHLSSFKRRLLAGISLAISAAAIYGVCFPIVHAGPPTTPQQTPQKNTLSGAQLYAIHCSRCHSERYATEFTAAHWQTIMIHMRVRANLPAAQAQEILKYLQEDAGQ